MLDISCWTPPSLIQLLPSPSPPHLTPPYPPPAPHTSSVSAKVSAEAEAQRLRADNLALEASLRKMMEKEVGG